MALQTMSEAERLAFFATPEGKAVQFSDERIRENLRDPSRKDREIGRALAFPVHVKFLKGFMDGLGNRYDWLLGLDDRFAPLHFMRLVCEGTNTEGLHDGWAKFLTQIDFGDLVFKNLGLTIPDMPSSVSLNVSAPVILPGQDVRKRVQELLVGHQMSPEQQQAFEKSLRDQQQKPHNPVQLNASLTKLLETKKIEVMEKFPHPVLAEIWAYPEFQALYRRTNDIFQTFLRVLTEERLKMKTPEKVFEVSFVLPGPLADHLDVVLQLARTVRPSFMTSPKPPGLPEGQKLLVMTTSDQRFQSPAELMEEIRTIAQKNGVALSSIDCRWNQEKGPTS